MKIKTVTQEDEAFWFSLDQHLDKKIFKEVVALKRGYVIEVEGKPVGILRWNLFWDNTPFLTMIYFQEAYRRCGYGKKVMTFWESELVKEGYHVAMTSTQVDEQAQHFYRKLGYKDCGCLVLDIPEMAQPLEMFLIKRIGLS